jgi:hypothetical protein
MRNMVWQLLRRNISAGQLIGYALANLAGLAIVISAIQFYNDVTAVWDEEDTFLTRDYMILSRKVTGLGSLISNGQPNGFSDKDISDLEHQDWVKRVGKFTAADFTVSATVDMGGAGMSTALFFEAIPDEFFDVQPGDWKFNPENPEIPIILSKDYLSLYNFGFASARGLPQLSESMIGLVPLRVSISGNGKQQWLPARVVGFSSRLNTIAVPEDFIEWANARFGENSGVEPQRLIVEVNRPGDPAIDKYLSDKGYESSGNNANSDKASYFLTIVTAVVITVGAIISLLAFFILMLSIYLLLQKNREKLHSLMMLGYSPTTVGSYYSKIVCAINGCVLLASIAIMLIGRHAWSEPLSQLGLTTTSPFTAITIGVIIIVVITVINIVAINRKMYSYFR